SLTVIDDDNSKDTMTKQVIVSNMVPTANLTPENITVYEGESTTFLANASDSLTDLEILNYKWYLKNGLGLELENGPFGGWTKNYLWLDNGNETVYLNVSDNFGASSLNLSNILIKNIPPSVSISRAYVQTNLSFIVYGSKNTLYNLTIFKDGSIYYSVIVEKINDTAELLKIPLQLEVNSNWEMLITYNNSKNKYSINQVILKFEFETNYDINYNFYLSHCFSFFNFLPWDVNLNDYFYCFPITLSGSVYDPGIGSRIH
ncbi:MAG: hypothetical protein ACTSRP_27715, partial [Candidatus Helarchaeota archaeon]